MQRKRSRRTNSGPKLETQAPVEAKLLVDEHELARLIGMSVFFLRKDRRQRRLIPFVRLGAGIRYHIPTVQSALLSRQEGGQHEPRHS